MGTDNDAPKSLSDLDKLIEKKKKSNIVWPYIVMSLFMFPLGLIFALFRDENFLRVFLPVLTIVYSILGLVSSLFFIVLNILGVNSLGKITFLMTTQLKALIILSIIFSFLGLFSGIHLRKKRLNNFSLSLQDKSILYMILVALLVLDSWIAILIGVSPI